MLQYSYCISLWREPILYGLRGSHDVWIYFDIGLFRADFISGGLFEPCLRKHFSEEGRQRFAL